jgi:catechol 2,3-dioxygenase-like lactoylglutathione lyase family enzyme
MLETATAFSGFSTDDLDAATAFYGGTLGLDVSLNAMGILELAFAHGGRVIVYPKPDHVPAAYTVLNFEVDDIDGVVDALVAAGVEVLRYDGLHQDEKGISRGKAAGMGPDIAWFTDPAGNILSVLSN